MRGLFAHHKGFRIGDGVEFELGRHQDGSVGTFPRWDGETDRGATGEWWTGTVTSWAIASPASTITLCLLVFLSNTRISPRYPESITPAPVCRPNLASNPDFGQTKITQSSVTPAIVIPVLTTACSPAGI